MNDRLRKFGLALHAGGLLAVVVAACAVHCFVCRPLLQERAEGLDRLGQLDGLLAGAEPIRQGYESLKQSLADAREREAALLSRIPQTPREAEFLALVSDLAGKVELRLRDYRPGETRVRATYSELEIGMSCEGSYQSICGFLDGLNHLPRLTNLTRLEITAQEGRDVYPA
ncbi:MAG TPA: type 4a pilus biogenesis protein PilO, partial [Pirellulales bacterium]|nr:type 4a pilus biogenesis protein PilO [Pirellulales bacterium]